MDADNSKKDPNMQVRAQGDFPMPPPPMPNPYPPEPPYPYPTPVPVSDGYPYPNPYPQPPAPSPYDKYGVKVQAESTFMHPAIDTKKELIDWVLTNLGYPLITVELTEQQFNAIIADSLSLYSKYASFPVRYLCLDLNDYVPGYGLDLRRWNVCRVNDIATWHDSMWGIGGNDVFFGFPAFMNGAMGGMPFFGNSANGTNWAGGWITYHNFVEFAELSRRMTGSNPDFDFNEKHQFLKLYPEPRLCHHVHDCCHECDKCHHDHKKCERKKCKSKPICIQCECEPSVSDLYGEEYVRRIVLAKAKILLGTIRSKFGSVQLIGGGQINTEIGQEGKDELNQIIEQIRSDESYGNMFYIT